MSAGLQVATARIAEIQSRLLSLQPARPATSPSTVDQEAFAQALTGAAGTVGSSAVAEASHTGDHVHQKAPTSADWATRLPEAGRAWSGEIEAAATRHGLDPALLASLVWSESGFRADARSHAGAIGLAQLMPATAAGLGVDPHDPVQNLDGGARFLKAQLDRFGRVDLALAAYNAGPGRVARAGGIPNIPETQAYVPSVLGHYDQLKGH